MWIIKHLDGSVSQHSDLSGMPEDAMKVELPRQLNFEIESWDWDTSTIVPYLAGQERIIDQGYGAAAIEKAHVLKVSEAQAHRTGQDISGGLLDQEAELSNEPLADLVAKVLNNHQEFVSRELERRAAKTRLRNDQLTT